MTFPGPPALGRGIVISPGMAVPEAFAAAPRFTVDDATLEEPAGVADRLHVLWVGRTPFVVELAVHQDRLRAPESTTAPPWQLGARFEFARERLHFLVWANTYDLRSGDPVWWHGVKAAVVGARAGGPCDVVLPDGTPAWVDGGPRGPVAVGTPVLHRESVGLGAVPPPPSGIADPTAGLAPDQAAAAGHGSGPSRVIAPAGSGKTRVLTARLRHLAAVTGIEHRLITAVAYNTRAAGQLRERLEGTPAHIRTIHSLGLWIVNRHRRSPATVVDEREVRRRLAPLLPAQPRSNQDIAAPYLEALAQVRIGLTDPEDVAAERDDVPDFPAVFARCHDGLHRDGAVDFDEQIYGALEILLADPTARAEAQLAATHLLVDEFQDLTPAYLLLLRLVAAPEYQVFGVGDDDQVIYGYAGADPGYLIDYATLFPGAASYPLEVNYRCAPDVVAAAATLLRWNRRRVPKEIRAAPGRDGRPGDLEVIDGGEAPGAAAGGIVAGWIADGAAPADIAVLARVNDALLPVLAALAERDIPVVSHLDTALLRRTGIRTALAYLRIALDPDEIDRADIAETVGRPSRRITRAMRQATGRRRRWSLDRLRAVAAGLDGGQADRALDYVDELERLAAKRERTTAELLRTIRSDIGLDEPMTALDGSRSAPDRSSHIDDLEALIDVAAHHPDPATFAGFLEELLSGPGNRDGVLLSSVHRVKGREWPRVLVFRADAGLMPHRLSGDVEEERRVFHVAITRGRDRVAVLTGDRPSPFVAQMRRAPTPADLAPKRAGRHQREPAAGIAIGDRVVAGGLAGVVAVRDADGILLATDTGAGVAVRFGETVWKHGTAYTLRPELVRDAAPVTPHDADRLYEELRAWRLDVSRAEGVPAFVVFSNAHLRGIAERAPRTVADLARCSGVGEVKLERYGEDVLDVIERVLG